MAKIYIHGCNCGGLAVQTARVKKFYPDLEVVNTRADKTRLIEHLEIQKNAGMPGSPVNILVEDGVVTLLNEWKPL